MGWGYVSWLRLKELGCWQRFEPELSGNLKEIHYLEAKWKWL